MSRSNGGHHVSGTEIRECATALGISPADYDDLIKALFLAAPKDPAAHAVTRFDTKGSPIATTFVSRIFDGVSISAEDRGAVYAVWVTKIDNELSPKEVIGFTQLPWEQR